MLKNTAIKRLLREIMQHRAKQDLRRTQNKNSRYSIIFG